MTECLSRVDSMGWSQSRARALVQVMGRWPELGHGAVDGMKGQHVPHSEGIHIDSNFYQGGGGSSLRLRKQRPDFQRLENYRTG